MYGQQTKNLVNEDAVLEVSQVFTKLLEKGGGFGVQVNKDIKAVRFFAKGVNADVLRTVEPKAIIYLDCHQQTIAELIINIGE